MISAILPSMTATGVSPFDLAAFRTRVDAELRREVAETRDQLARRDPEAAFLADELGRLIDAGGSRLRPICCGAGFLAGGGQLGDAIVEAAAALEFLHLLALVHDDVMDEAKERRGVPSSHRHLAELAVARGARDEGDHTGTSLAIVVGDLAEVCADRLFGLAGFPPDRLSRALERYHELRLDMAAGQALDVLGVGDPLRVAALKGGSYSIAGPLLLGAALAGAPREVDEALVRFGEPLGTAFQLRDDLRDGDAGAGVDASTVASLVASAREALEDAPFDPGTLRAIADQVEGT